MGRWVVLPSVRIEERRKQPTAPSRFSYRNERLDPRRGSIIFTAPGIDFFKINSGRAEGRRWWKIMLPQRGGVKIPGGGGKNSGRDGKNSPPYSHQTRIKSTFIFCSYGIW